MIFKQNVLKEEKIKFLSVVIGVLVSYIAILVIGLIKNENPKLLVFLSIIFLPILILMILIWFKYLEWYCIYDDHIEVRNIYGKKKLSINLSNDKFLIYVDDIKLIDIKSNKNKNDLINLDFQVSNILNNYQGSVVLTKFDNNKGSFLFSFKDTNNNDVSAEIKMDLVFGDIKSNEFDYTDAVLIDDITEDELLDIKNNLFNAIWDQVSNPEETVNNNNEEPSN